MLRRTGKDLTLGETFRFFGSVVFQPYYAHAGLYKTNSKWLSLPAETTCLIVAPHSIAEGFVGGDLCLSTEEGLEAFLHSLELLSVELEIKERSVQ